jgi:ATP-dependent Clp protease protease subunit
MAEIDIETGQHIVDTLKTFKDGILLAYESRTGLGRERLAKMMAGTTWMSARNAVQLGFADEVLVAGEQAVPAIQNSFVNSLATLYSNIPAEVLNMAEPVAPPAPVVDEVFERAADALRDKLDLHLMQKEI